MGKGYFGKIAELYTRPVDALGLACFRVAYSCILLLEVKQLFTFRALIFSEVATPGLLITGLLVVWAISLVGLFVGWFTRWSAGVNYVIGVFMVWQMPAFKYHFDFVMTTVNFLLLFLPVATVFSVDRYRQQKKVPHQILPDQVRRLYVWLLVVPGLGLVYLDAAVNKLDSEMWWAGLGFWLPSSLPQNARINLSGWLNQPHLVQIIGYGILVFEWLFLLLVAFKPLRWVVLTAGLFLHLGIGLAYPIPHFALLMLALYIPLVPDAWWQKLRLIFGLPLRPPANQLINKNLFGSRALGWGLVYAVAGQGMCLLAAPVVQHLAAEYNLKKPLATTQNLFKPFYFINQKFLGIVSHDIFLDKHFTHYTKIVNLSYLDKAGRAYRLPLFTPTGQPGPYLTGRLWTKWAYRITGAQPQKQPLDAGIKQFARFWAQQHNLSLEQAIFLIRVKKIQSAKQWQKDFLNKQLKQPWRTAGRLTWQQQQGRIDWFNP